MYNYTNIEPEKCEFVDIGSIHDLGSGERLFIELNGKSIVVINIEGSFFAIDDICSHDDGPLGEGDLEGYEIVCPRHGAKFDIRNGKALSLPAVVDITAYPIMVAEGRIKIGIPRI